VSDIKYVLNYDYPNNSEDYVHRIGRTGRSDNSGISYTFFTPANAPKTRDLIKVMEEAKQPISPELARLAASGGSGGGRSYGRPGGKRGHSDAFNGGPAKRPRTYGGPGPNKAHASYSNGGGFAGGARW